MRLIECVPNFSEGRNMEVVDQITAEIKSVEGVSLLNVDPGKATNRTVVTFVGGPDAVIEAAFLAIKKAAALIDMARHKGAHPRFGATDVCPLVPVSDINMDGQNTTLDYDLWLPNAKAARSIQVVGSIQLQIQKTSDISNQKYSINKISKNTDVFYFSDTHWRSLLRGYGWDDIL